MCTYMLTTGCELNYLRLQCIIVKCESGKWLLWIRLMFYCAWISNQYCMDCVHYWCSHLRQSSVPNNFSSSLGLPKTQIHSFTQGPDSFIHPRPRFIYKLCNVSCAPSFLPLSHQINCVVSNVTPEYLVPITVGWCSSDAFFQYLLKNSCNDC